MSAVPQGQPRAVTVATIAVPPPPAPAAAANVPTALRPFMPRPTVLVNGNIPLTNARAAQVLSKGVTSQQPGRAVPAAAGPSVVGANGGTTSFGPQPAVPGAQQQQQQSTLQPMASSAAPTAVLVSRPPLPAASAAAAPSSMLQPAPSAPANGLLGAPSAPVFVPGVMAMSAHGNPPLPTSVPVVAPFAPPPMFHLGTVTLGPSGLPTFRPGAFRPSMFPPGVPRATAFQRPPFPQGPQVMSGLGPVHPAAPAAAAAARASTSPATNGNPASGVPAAAEAGGAASDGGACPSLDAPAVSTSDIQMVQNLIERCLQLYMTQAEVVSILHSQAKIEPGFTQLVWQKLEEQNTEFFRCYYTRLKLKAQIIMFNHLLKQQVDMVEKLQRGWVAGPSGFGPLQPFSSTTASGIPLFQSSGGGGRTEGGDPAAAAGASVQEQHSCQRETNTAGLGDSGGLGSPSFGSGLEGGISPLLPHSTSGADVAEQSHSGGGNHVGCFIPAAAILQAPSVAGGAGANGGGGDPVTVPHNVSLPDLALENLQGGDLHMEDLADFKPIVLPRREMAPLGATAAAGFSGATKGSQQ